VSLPAPAAVAGDGESAARLALAGQGLARLAHFHIGPDLAAGRLVTVLDAFNPGDLESRAAPSMSAMAASCRPGCGRSSTSWRRRSIPGGKQWT
jgi:DNA-binding transcriptional LysR family regulator